VDGFPYAGNINTIPVGEIESVTVLKDAAATALYGSRAANGVIIITTKRGSSDKTVFNVRADVGASVRGIPEYDRISTPQYLEKIWERIYLEERYVTNTGGNDAAWASVASNQLMPRLGEYNPYNVAGPQLIGADGRINPAAQLLWTDDWYEEMHRTGIRKDFSVSASGGDQKNTYFLSANLLNDQGIVRASNFDRFSVRLNLESKMKDWLKVGMNLGGSTSNQNFPVSDGTAYVNSFMFSRMVAPIYPVYIYEPDGTPVLDAEGNKIPDYGATFGRARAYIANSNPLGTIILDTRDRKRDAVTLRGFAEISFLNDFKLMINASTDLYSFSALTHQNAQFGDAAAFDGRSTRSYDRTFSFSTNQLLTWNKDFDKHSFEALVGHESTQYLFHTLSATRTGFSFPGFVELSAAATAEGSGSQEDNHRLESYFSRLNYSYAFKYYLSLSFRTDASSRFHSDERWGSFWSVGGSWRASQEEFLKDLDWLTNLSLRASYGELGNEALPSLYAYWGLFGLGWDNLGFPGSFPATLANSGLSWEKNKTLNLGVEFRLFDKITVNFEYYDKNTDDLLFQRPVPPSTGFQFIDDNVGAIRNYGFDVEVYANFVRTRNFSWDMDVMFGQLKNEITALPQEQMVVGNKRWEVGKSIYDFWIQEYAGLNANGQPLWYKDIIDGFDDNGDPIIVGRETTSVYGDADRYYLGTAIPDFEGSITNRFKFGNVDFSFMLTFSKGGMVYDGVYQGLMHNGTYGTHWHQDILNSWTPDNTNTDVPVLIGNQNYSGQSNYWLTPRDYLSIRNVVLGYNLPKPVLNKLGLTTARIIMTGTNLYTFTNRKGMDPTQSFAGGQGHNYTPIRTISLGLNLNF
jgi:TonB-linked SusC/RagA family outer membrane protein